MLRLMKCRGHPLRCKTYRRNSSGSRIIPRFAPQGGLKNKPEGPKPSERLGRALVQRFQDGDARVHEAAVTALAMIGDELAIAELLEGRGIFPSGPFEDGELRWRTRAWTDFFHTIHRQTGRYITSAGR